MNMVVNVFQVLMVAVRVLTAGFLVITMDYMKTLKRRKYKILYL